MMGSGLKCWERKTSTIPARSTMDMGDEKKREELNTFIITRQTLTVCKNSESCKKLSMKPEGAGRG